MLRVLLLLPADPSGWLDQERQDPEKQLPLSLSPGQHLSCGRIGQQPFFCPADRADGRLL